MWASRWAFRIRVWGCLSNKLARIDRGFGSPSRSTVLSFRVSVVIVLTSWERCGRREPGGEGTGVLGRGAVIKKSVSVFLIVCSVLVSYHTPKPLLLLCLPGLRYNVKSSSCWSSHVSINDSAGNSQIKSQGRTRKSPEIAASISGSVRIVPVGVTSSSSSGARTVGLGDKEVR